MVFSSNQYLRPVCVCVYMYVFEHTFFLNGQQQEGDAQTRVSEPRRGPVLMRSLTPGAERRCILPATRNGDSIARLCNRLV